MVAGGVGAVVSATPAAAAPGDITTIAGGNPGPPSGNGGLATAASLPDPWGLKGVGSTLYVSEEHPDLVRKVDNGVITGFAGGGTAPLGDGLQARDATFNGPQGLTFDAAGNMYVADSANNRVRRIDAVTRVITTVAGTGTAGFAGDGGPATSAELDHPLRLAVDAFANVFISDDSNRIRRVDAVTHFITTVVGTGSSSSSGDGGPATSAGINPRGIAFDLAGNFYIADVGAASVRRVTPGPDGVINGGPGEIITTYVGGGTLLLEPANEGKPALHFSLLDSQAFPEGLAFDTAGNLFVSLVASPRVIEVAAAGDHALMTVAGDGVPADLGPTGAGGPATAGHLDFPFGVTVDPAGNVYIADLGSSNSRVRRVDAVTHVITTVSGLGQTATFGAFGSYGDGGPAVDAPVAAPADVAFFGGYLFFVDRETDRVRRVDANGIITTYAGGGVNDGPASTAVLDHPRGLDADAAGNVYIADCGDGRVRKVTPGGTVSTVAGGGENIDFGKATNAALGCPSDVSVVRSGPDAGTIFIADTADRRSAG
ncbi:MAG: NHL repeat-containing protein [Acidimicrobiales bacterium]